MQKELDRGSHIHFTTRGNYIIYNAIIIDKVYLKGKGYFYEILHQELPVEESRRIYNNHEFKRTWYIYKDKQDNSISVPFIPRHREWLRLEENLKYNPYYYNEVHSKMKKYGYKIRT